MRAWILLALAAAPIGCATHRPPVEAGRPVSHDWATVLAIPARTYVFAALDGNEVSHGYLERVTDTTLTIRPRGSGVRTIPRATVVRVETTVRLKNDDALNGFPIGVGTVAGAAGTMIGAVVKNRKVQGWSLAVLGTSIVAGFAYLSRHPQWEPDYATRVVYVRR